MAPAVFLVFWTKYGEKYQNTKIHLESFCHNGTLDGV